MINVTKAYLPDFETYQDYLKGIWERVWLTNHGPLVLELEEKLRTQLGVKHCFFVNNGTIALQIAIKALDLKGEVITTPFSYVATTSSLSWEQCTPVFVDVEPGNLTLDPAKIEQAITPLTTAILATHVYGNPCDVEAIEIVAKKHGLKVIYDAAHAFAVEYHGKGVLNYGDISTLSFHATKLFHTVEGGAIVTNDDDLAHKISYMRNFGHDGPEHFFGCGINGKSSEFHAAMGLCVLPDVPKIIARRKTIIEQYRKLLTSPLLTHYYPRQGAAYNYAYFPIIFNSESQLLKTKSLLAENEIMARRYFYPALNTLDYVKYQPCSVAEDISKRVLCLPLYYDLSESDIERIGHIVNKSLI